MKNAWYLLLVLFFFASCDKDDDVDPAPPESGAALATFDVCYTIVSNGQTVELGDEFMDGSYPVLLEGLRYYVSNVRLEKEGGTSVLLSEIELLKADDINRSYQVEEGEYTSIKFDLGVPASLNTDTDPASFANDHPLGFTGSQGMFWTWNVGYIFVKFDGRANTDGNTNGDHNQPIFYHVGNDDFLTSMSFDLSLDLAEGDDEGILFEIQLDALLSGATDPIDVSDESQTGTHSSGNEGYQLADRFMQNFSESIQLVE